MWGSHQSQGGGANQMVRCAALFDLHWNKPVFSSVLCTLCNCLCSFSHCCLKLWSPLSLCLLVYEGMIISNSHHWSISQLTSAAVLQQCGLHLYVIVQGEMFPQINSMCDLFAKSLGLKYKSFWQDLFNFFAKMQFEVDGPMTKKKTVDTSIQTVIVIFFLNLEVCTVCGLSSEVVFGMVFFCCCQARKILFYSTW